MGVGKAPCNRRIKIGSEKTDYRHPGVTPKRNSGGTVPFLSGALRLAFCGKGAVAATKVGGAVFHQEGGQFGINVVG